MTLSTDEAPDVLTREAALSHPAIDDFWAVVDFVLEHDPTVNHHVYGHLDE